VPDPESTELIRPGDVREYDEEPAFGPWELLDKGEPDGPEGPGSEGSEAGAQADAGSTAPAAPAAPSFVTPPAAPKEF
jgi:hypothetical protein